MEASPQTLAAITAERDHWERRCERYTALEIGGRRDDNIGSEYADGVRYGLDLALMVLQP